MDIELQPAHKNPDLQPATEEHAQPLRVLLIEDNPLDARLIQIMLAEAGGGRFKLE